MGFFRKIVSLFKPIQEISTGENTVEELVLTKIRQTEEERKNREWLDFLKNKRAKRRKELEEQLIIIDKQLAFIQEHILAIQKEKRAIEKNQSPNLSISCEYYNPKSGNQFDCPEFGEITTMQELLRQRIEDERKKVEAAESIALINIEGARNSIKNRDLNKAKEYLDIISMQTAFIENIDINNAIKEIVFGIAELSNLLAEEKREEKEFRRKQEALAAQQRIQALERQQQEEGAKKLQEQEERKERARKYENELRRKEKAQQNEINHLNGLSSTFKHDAQGLIKFLRDNGIFYLYHFTEACNLPLIKSRKGLYSWSYLFAHNMKIPSPGGNDTSRGLDRDKGLEDYVHLSLCKYHPVAYRIYQENEGRANLVLLKIKIDVAIFESTLFSNINATDNGAKIGSDMAFIQENIDFEAINLELESKNKKRLAEVMVKTYIPSKYIVNLDNPETMIFNN